MTPSDALDILAPARTMIKFHDWLSLNGEFTRIAEFICKISNDRDRLADRVLELERRVSTFTSLDNAALEQRLAIAEADKEILGSALSEALSHFVHPQSIGAVENAYSGTIWKEARTRLYQVLESAHPGTAITQRLAGMQEALKDAYGLLARIVVDAKESRSALLEDGREWAKLFVSHNLIKEADRMTEAKQAIEGGK